MDTPNTETPNILNRVLQPEPEGLHVTPPSEPATDVVRGAATETKHAAEELDSPGLSADTRRSMAGQASVRQGAQSAVCQRILARSRRVAEEAEVQPEEVDNLLLCETALGTIRQAVWPITAYGLVITRDTGAQIDETLDEIDQIAETPAGRPVKLALGKAQHGQERVKRSQQGKKKGKQQRRAAGAGQLTQGRRRIAGQKNARGLTEALGQGTATPVLALAGNQVQDGAKAKAKAKGSKTPGK